MTRQRYQYLNTQSDPYLDLYCISSRFKKVFDIQIILDQFEELIDPPGLFGDSCTFPLIISLQERK